MQPETQHKAVAGGLSAALSAFVASLVPFVLSLSTGSSHSEEQISNLLITMTALGTTLVGLFVGWVGVYFAPRNKPLPGPKI